MSVRQFCNDLTQMELADEDQEMFCSDMTDTMDFPRDRLALKRLVGRVWRIGFLAGAKQYAKWAEEHKE